MKNKYIMAAVAAVMLFAAQTSALAIVVTPTYTKTATMTVSLNNIATVSVSTTPVNFGDVSTATTSPRATGSITVKATSGTVYKMSINKGLHSTAGRICRSMSSANGAASRAYQTYLDAAHGGNTWGDTDTQNTCSGHTNSGLSVAVTGSGANQTRVVNVIASAGGQIGRMSDVLTVTVSY